LHILHLFYGFLQVAVITDMTHYFVYKGHDCNGYDDEVEDISADECGSDISTSEVKNTDSD
jgi:hypothetical protein